MVSFRKNKADVAAKRHRYRYDIVPTADEEIADVLLEQQEKPSEQSSHFAQSESVEKAEEVIYELVDEAKTESAEAKPDEAADTALVTESTSADAHSLNAQVERLSREYELVNQQLEKSLLASIELSNQLEKSKKVVFISQLGLAIACVALLLGVIATIMNANTQRDVVDLGSSVATTATVLQTVKKESALKEKEMSAQIEQLNGKINTFFAADNLDNIIASAKKLKKKPQSLINKDVAEVALPLSTKHEDAKSAIASSKAAANAKTATEKKEPNDKVAALATHDAVAVGSNWVVSLGSFKNKATANNKANKFKKASMPLEVVEIKIKQHSWYRVVAKTFKNKHDAQNYAEHLKKILGIRSIVVTKS